MRLNFKEVCKVLVHPDTKVPEEVKQLVEILTHKSGESFKLRKYLQMQYSGKLDRIAFVDLINRAKYLDNENKSFEDKVFDAVYNEYPVLYMRSNTNSLEEFAKSHLDEEAFEHYKNHILGVL